MNFLLIVCFDVMILCVYFGIRNGQVDRMLGRILSDIKGEGNKKILRYQRYVDYGYILYARALTPVSWIEKELRKKIFRKVEEAQK